jgi:translation initiation factor eIF-2B subunit alpha
MARALCELGVPVTLVLDAGVACALERVDVVLVGAEGVVESGGVINKLGTYQIALCAKALGRPFYVAAESYKFARLYPLNQADLPLEHKPVDLGPLLPRSVQLSNPSRDYTPPGVITLLVTDLGVLTPAAVSDELIQLYV